MICIIYDRTDVRELHHELFQTSQDISLIFRIVYPVIAHCQFEYGMVLSDCTLWCIFLHVNHVPNNFCTWNKRPWTANQEGSLIYRYGDSGRSGVSSVNGLCIRFIYHVNWFLCPYPTVCVYSFLCTERASC